MCTLNVAEDVAAAFSAAMMDFLASRAMQVVQSGLKVEHYASALREIYHYTKENPQMQVSATAFFRGDDRKLVAMFLRHALAEVGHDHLALDDLAALGVDVSDVKGSQPLPSTSALTAYGYYQIQMRNPIGYLGYLYFLERLPTQYGDVFSRALAGAGIQKTAMTFLADHMHFDLAHNKLMDEYLDQLVHTRADLDAVIYGIHACSYLYSRMLEGAIDRVEKPAVGMTCWEDRSRIRAAALSAVGQ